jgi:hypothetical protein
LRRILKQGAEKMAANGCLLSDVLFCGNFKK